MAAAAAGAVPQEEGSITVASSTAVPTSNEGAVSSTPSSTPIKQVVLISMEIIA